MKIQVKLINGYWMAEISGKLERYSELPNTLRKLYGILLQVEIITKKHNLKF